MSEYTKGAEITCTSMIGLDTGKPLVEIAWAGTSIQLEASEARAVGLSIIRASEAALSDLALYRVMDESGSSLEEIATVIQACGSQRQKIGGEGG